MRKKGGDDAHVHEKQCNGLTLEKDMCVSFVCEDSGKGPAAKDLRREDPARVARVTAKVHYGNVEVRAPSFLAPFFMQQLAHLCTQALLGPSSQQARERLWFHHPAQYDQLWST